MKKYTKEEAEKLYPGVSFGGDVHIGRDARIEIDAYIESGVIIKRGAHIGAGRRGVTKCLTLFEALFFSKHLL